MGLAEAAVDLENWKLRSDELSAERDPLVRAAYEAGISIKGISQLSGLSRTTVYKILGLEPASGEHRHHFVMVPGGMACACGAMIGPGGGVEG